METMRNDAQGFGITTARDVAERHLRSVILEGRVGPGERINEVLIADELGISRGPLREAVQRLSSEGLLTQVRNKGAYVSRVDAEEVTELYEARIALERRAVKLVANRRSDAQLADLERMLDETTTALEAGDGGAYPSDLDFHRAIIAMAGNHVIARMAEEVQTRLQLARARSARDPRRAAVALEEHRQIVKAMIEGQGEFASQIMEEHLYHSLNNALTQA